MGDKITVTLTTSEWARVVSTLAMRRDTYMEWYNAYGREVYGWEASEINELVSKFEEAIKS